MSEINDALKTPFIKSASQRLLEAQQIGANIHRTEIVNSVSVDEVSYNRWRVTKNDRDDRSQLLYEFTDQSDLASVLPTSSDVVLAYNLDQPERETDYTNNGAITTSLISGVGGSEQDGSITGSVDVNESSVTETNSFLAFNRTTEQWEGLAPVSYTHLRAHET